MSLEQRILAFFASLMLLGIGPATRAEEGGKRSRKEVLALIEKAGQAKPEWWDKTVINHPKTLDLSWPKAKRK